MKQPSLFSYCPMEMSEAEALKLARPHLKPNVIVIVEGKKGIRTVAPGKRLKAPLPDTYLIQVDETGTTRCVDRNITG